MKNELYLEHYDFLYHITTDKVYMITMQPFIVKYKDVFNLTMKGWWYLYNINIIKPQKRDTNGILSEFKVIRDLINLKMIEAKECKKLY